jgi:hypothetical protein
MATDSYPSAPHVNNGYLGNGVYGNALMVNNTGTQTGAWYWDGKGWIRTKSIFGSNFTTRPVFDPMLRKSIALAGGETGDPVTTWAWNASSWASLSEGPPGGAGPQLAFDSATNQMIAVLANADRTASSTWIFDGSHWHEVGGHNHPPARWSAGFAYDPGSRRLVLHGGISAQVPSQGVSFADTWTWDGKTWTELHPLHNPPPGWNSLAYDPGSQRLILVNVPRPDELGPLTEISTWSWYGEDWHRLSPHRLPAIGIQPSLTYDASNHQFLLFEGTLQASPGDDGSQTWVLAKNTWTRVG